MVPKRYASRSADAQAERRKKRRDEARARGEALPEYRFNRTQENREEENRSKSVLSPVLPGDNVVEEQETRNPIIGLFVLSCSYAPNILKIASAVDPEAHRQSLEQGHDFQVHLLAVFPGSGHLLEQVQGMLQGQISRKGRGANWFEVSLQEVLEKIRTVLRRF